MMEQKVYSPLMRRHAATVSDIHRPTVDVTSSGGVHVSVVTTKDLSGEPTTLRNKHHEGLARQRSRSEADILGLLDALKMLEEGTLSGERPNSAMKDGKSKERKISGGIKVG